jgi:hypothetical protein
VETAHLRPRSSNVSRKHKILHVCRCLGPLGGRRPCKVGETWLNVLCLLTRLSTGMLLLAAWSTNGWLPAGHAMRMALDLGLHRALDRLAEDTGKPRIEEEERDLGMILLFTFDVDSSPFPSRFVSHLALPVLL